MSPGYVVTGSEAALYKGDIWAPAGKRRNMTIDAKSYISVNKQTLCAVVLS